MWYRKTWRCLNLTITFLERGNMIVAETCALYYAAARKLPYWCFCALSFSLCRQSNQIASKSMLTTPQLSPLISFCHGESINTNMQTRKHNLSLVMPNQSDKQAPPVLPTRPICAVFMKSDLSGCVRGAITGTAMDSNGMNDKLHCQP